METGQEKWDVFISYASEDLDAIAAPLAHLLAKLGVAVWFDRTSLALGDSLRLKIDEGLAKSRYGVVILSEAFFAKHYPNRELAGLAQREVDGESVILPIWHGVTAERVRTFSPPLADRLAVSSGLGVLDVARRILEVIRPDIVEKLVRAAKTLEPLPEVHEGRTLATIISGAHAFLPHYEPGLSSEEVELVADFLQECQDWGDLLEDMEVGERVRTEARLSEGLTILHEADIRVYGRRQKRRLSMADQESDWTIAVVAVMKGSGKRVTLQGNTFTTEHVESDP